jgi:sugar phosphate permease
MGYKDAFLRVAFVSSLALIPACAMLYFSQSYYAALAATGLASFFYSMPMAPAASALQLVTPNRMRGIATSIYVFFSSVIGLGIAPTLVALITDHVFQDERRVGEALPLVCGIAALAAAIVMRNGLRPYSRLAEEQAASLPSAA